MWATYEKFEIQMTLKQAKSASHAGRCDEDVKSLLVQKKIKRQLDKISDDDLRYVLGQYGAWSEEELGDRGSNEERIIWIAASDIIEDMFRRG